MVATNSTQTDVSTIDQPAAGFTGSDWESLARWWAEWIKMVDDLAKNPGRRKPSVEKQYEAVFAKIMQLCQAGDQHSVGERKNVCARAKSLISPWVTVHSLEAAEIEILAKLLGRARNLQDQLHGHALRVGFRLRPILGFLFAGGLAALVLTVAIAGSGSGTTSFASAKLRYFFGRYGNLLADSVSAVQNQVIVLGGFVSILLILLVWKSARRV